MKETTLEQDLAKVLNNYGIDNKCSCPDFILATYLVNCLRNYIEIHDANRIWHGYPAEEEI